MGMIDTSSVMARMKQDEPIEEDVSIITVIEHPPLLEYKRFFGDIIYPEKEDIRLALLLQKSLMRIGRMKSADDLIIAATCINYSEELLTGDSDFEDIGLVSELRIKQ